MIIHYSICHFEGVASWNGGAASWNKKEAWLAFQGNNEGRSGRLKTDAGGDEKLTFKFVWPYALTQLVFTFKL